MEKENATPEKHDIPRCTCCGHIGKWKVEPVLTGKHWGIGLLLMVLGIVPGVVFLGVTMVVRSNQKNRNKICLNCGAHNLFTFFY